MPRSVAGWLDVLLVAGAVVLIAASAAALGAEAWWRFELFTHFRVQYLAAQAPLLVLLLLGRRLLLGAALAVAALPNAAALAPYWPGGAASAEAGQVPVTLMSVNVHLRNRSYDALLEIVDEERPDLLLVLELTEAWRRALAPLREHYPHRIMLPRADAFGIALLSRYPMQARSIRIETAPAIDARISAPQGSFRLIGVHLRAPTSAEWARERNLQLDALGMLVREADPPLAVAGDFNVTPYSPYFGDWLRRNALIDARRDFGPGISWPAFLPILGIPIDHCIVSPDIGVAAFRRLPDFGSDHYPILIELLLESSHDP